MNNIESVSKEVDKYSQSIAEYLSEMKLWDNERIVPAISVRIKYALRECYNMFSIQLKGERTELVRQYNDENVPNWKKNQIKVRLAELNTEIKSVNKSRDIFYDVTELYEIKSFLMKQHPEVWEDYKKIQTNK